MHPHAPLTRAAPAACSLSSSARLLSIERDRPAPSSSPPTRNDATTRSFRLQRFTASQLVKKSRLAAASPGFIPHRAGAPTVHPPRPAFIPSLSGSADL